MDTAINFYELSTQLADLGFGDPALIDQLRVAMSTEKNYGTLNTEQQNTIFQFNLESDYTNTLQLTSVDAVLKEGKELRDQVFMPNVPAKAMILFLKDRLDGPDVSSDIAGNPVSKQEVFLSLGLNLNAGLQELNETANFYDLKSQLNKIGFYQPDIIKQLREAVHTEFSYEGLYINRGSVRFQIDLDKDSAGILNFTSYGAILESENKIREQLFGPGVQIDDAFALLQRRLLHTMVDVKISAEPMNSQEVRAYLNNNSNTNQLNINTMNTENLNYLQKQLLNLGFGEGMNKELEKQIKAKTPEFTIGTTLEYNKQNVDYTLHYKAGDKDEMYFFNKYDAEMQGKDMQQTFYINKGSGITAKEAYNLMDGRAVHKQLENQEGEKYNAWLVLDKANKTEGGNHKLNHFTDKWNYKPERAIDKMDIVGIGEEGAREKLLKSLEKGNRHQVTAMKDSKEVKLWLEANPAEHRVNLTNYKGEAQKLEHYKKPELQTETKKDQKQSQSPQDDGAKKKQSRGKKMTV